MKKMWIGIINILIMVLIVVFVFVYVNLDHKNVYNQQIENFKNTAIRTNNMTENYLKSEQDVCDLWANYINSESMTLDEAWTFVRTSKEVNDVSGHIIFKDNLKGLSTSPSIRNESDYSVSYSEINVFDNKSWINDGKDVVNISRAYTNPINAEQSFCFCRSVKILDSSNNLKDAYLLRVVPVSFIADKLASSKESGENTKLSLIDIDGYYIIKDTAYKNSNFFEFYKSYNKATNDELDSLKETVLNENGTFELYDSQGNKCIICHTPVASVGGWVLLSFTNLNNLKVTNDNWTLVLIVGLGLIALFIVDLIFLQLFNRRLKELRIEADEANKAKTDFLSTMSHDIRTPMNAITGLTYLTEKNIDNPEIVKENIKKISLAGNHLVTLINDILDISKVESGKITLNPSNFSIVETIENLINISEPMIKDKGLDFKLHINNFYKEYLFDDQLRLNQIFINILSNAIKYTETGGKVNLTLFEEESDKSGYVKLTYIVEDTGIGMSKEFMDKMYEPFIRQTDSRLNSIEGTGLGLSITKKMVSLMGGTIDCESELGKGTKFTIVLDLKISDINIDMKLNPIDILIIDKDEFELETTSSIIKSLGANTNICNNDKEAYDLINERMNNQFDVILIDSNSFDDEFIKNINNLINEKTIILISSFDLNKIENSFDNKSIGFIKKPLFKSKLYYKINEMLGNDKNIINKEDDYSDLKGLNVLIAEDNDINYEIISQMLDMIGINTERAIDGEDCLNKIISSEENKYQLIFMDIQMPKMNGLDVTKNIRNLDTWAKSIPIVAMTADAFSENIAECLNVGMNGHIAKPIDFKLVIKEIRKIKEK